MPNGKGFLGKIFKKKPATSGEVITKKTVTTPGKEYSRTQSLTPGRSISREVFRPQDRNPDVVKNRYTTPGLGKSLKEEPAKSQKRQNIQDVGMKGGDIKSAGGYKIKTKTGSVAAYDSGKRKGELAGEYRKLDFKVPEAKHTIKYKTPGSSTEIISRKTPASEISQKGVRQKDKAEPVSWVKGQKSGPGGFRATENYSLTKRARKTYKRHGVKIGKLKGA